MGEEEVGLGGKEVGRGEEVVLGGEEVGWGVRRQGWVVRRRGRNSSKLLLLIFSAFSLHSTLLLELSPCSSASSPYIKAED